mmetsp:Transcript_18053/g.56646  ORF Transcript_18053/g.56646 Transcript_18053/m.56646 type:complete len:206 (+) Transcript_18053:1320-1937(+)
MRQDLARRHLRLPGVPVRLPHLPSAQLRRFHDLVRLLRRDQRLLLGRRGIQPALYQVRRRRQRDRPRLRRLPSVLPRLPRLPRRDLRQRRHMVQEGRALQELRLGRPVLPAMPRQRLRRHLGLPELQVGMRHLLKSELLSRTIFRRAARAVKSHLERRRVAVRCGRTSRCRCGGEHPRLCGRLTYAGPALAPRPRSGARVDEHRR